MISTKTTRLLIALMATSLLAACSKGFDTLNTTGNSNQGSNSGQGGTTPPPAGPSEFDKLKLDSYVEGGNYNDKQVVALDKVNNALLIYLPVPVGSPILISDLAIPQLKGVKISTVLDSQQNARIVLSVPLNLVVRDKVTVLPSASTLPNGRPLPGMPSGEFPSLGLSINPNSSDKIYLYLGVNAIGLYLESAFFPEFPLTPSFQIKNQARTRTLGFLTLVPKVGTVKGGLFIAFQMPKDLATIIDNHLSGIIN